MTSFGELRVVGFGGDFNDVCGYTFPIVRHIHTNQHFDLSIDEPSEEEGTARLRESQSSPSPGENVPEPDHVYSEEEIDELFKEGELIRLPVEFPAVPD